MFSKRSLRGVLVSCLCLLLAVSTLISCSSCALGISASELSAGFNRTATEKGLVSDEFKAAMADFSMSLFKGIITKDSENDLVSPLSAIICLAMIANGADGDTRSQMEAVFGMDIATLNECLYAYTSSLYSSGDCKLNLADSIWFRDEKSGLHVNESFLQTNANWYDAQIYAAPFDDTTLKDINNWCKKHTGGMIEKMIDEIPADTVMYLINALSFDAKWEGKYEKGDVQDGTFKNYDGTTASVKMLSSEEGVYLTGEGVIGFAKKYSGGAYSIVALLPDEGADIYEYIASLDGGLWMSLWESRQSTAVRVKMPEFTYSAKMKLNDTLSALGMTDMFSGDAADFSNLGYSEIGNIYCSSVEQKVFIQVDRHGTKAAAITWGNIKNESAPIMPYVALDRPFVFAIADNATGLPLFVGAVTVLG